MKRLNFKILLLMGLIFSTADAMAIGQVALCDGGSIRFHAFTPGGEGPFNCDSCTILGQEAREFLILSRNADGKPLEIEITEPQNLGIHLFYEGRILRAVSDESGDTAAQGGCRRMDL